MHNATDIAATLARELGRSPTEPGTQRLADAIANYPGPIEVVDLPANFHVTYMAQVPGRKSFTVRRRNGVAWLSDAELIALCDGPPNPGCFGGSVEVHESDLDLAFVDVYTD